MMHTLKRWAIKESRNTINIW